MGAGARRPHRLHRRSRRLTALAPGVVGLVLVAGCTAGAAPPPGALPSTEPAASPAGSVAGSAALATRTPAPSGTAPSGAAPSGAAPGRPSAPYPADVPAAARAYTAAGAEAFVRLFLSQLNRAWTAPQAGLMTPLCSVESKACASFERTAAELVRTKQRYIGAPLSVRSVAALPERDGLTEVDVQGRQERRDVIDAQGHVVLTDPEEPSHFSILLSRVPDGWLVLEVRVVK